MLSRILLALTLAAPITVLAQYATTGPNGQVAPAGSTVVVVGNGGGPILSTPSVTFGTPQSTAGISLADHAGNSQRIRKLSRLQQYQYGKHGSAADRNGGRGCGPGACQHGTNDQ